MIATTIAKLSSLPVQDILICAGAFLFFVGGPLIFLFVVFRALRTGIVSARYADTRYRRDTQPIYFWFLVTIYTGVALGIGGAGVFVASLLWFGY
jgi:hypothetical protein